MQKDFLPSPIPPPTIVKILLRLCRFYFDFSPTYVGCGLICPHIVNCSVLFGAIVSWGFLWPYINTRAGDWFPADLGSNDFKGLYGYKVLYIRLILHFMSAFALIMFLTIVGLLLLQVFIAIALILGDGLYNLIKIVAISIKAIWSNSTKQANLPVTKVILGEIKLVDSYS